VYRFLGRSCTAASSWTAVQGRNSDSRNGKSALVEEGPNPMRKRITTVAGACALLMVTTWLPTSVHATPNPQVTPLGASYGEWNARWWQWFFSVPASKNPGLAKNGAVDCTVGQTGDVWFLAGSFPGSGSFVRHCSIPVGTSLVVPLINAWVDNVCNSPPL